MDRLDFDSLTKLLASSPSRRAALGALLGAGLAGALGTADAAKKDRRKHRGGKKSKDKGKGKGAAQVSAQAVDCLSPGPSANMNGCPFQGSDFSGDDLSGSSMVGTIFTNADLVGTNLSSSTMRNASFRGANLTCADLSSSTLRGADFRGFAPLQGSGRVTDLTRADLSSSGGCGTVLTNNRTILCGTTWCDGSIRNDACPGGPPAGFCCRDADCPAGETCDDGTCARQCPTGEKCGERSPGVNLRCCDGVCPAPTCLTNGAPCGTPNQCSAACCTGLATCGDPSFCHCFVRDIVHGTPLAPCASDIDCNNRFGAAWCVCGSCCVPRGHQKDPALPCSACCSGDCGASTAVCA